jgi:opacity protein-like surface antigen
MVRSSMLVALLMVPVTVSATDLLLLAGYQYNGDFEVAAQDPALALPPGSAPGDSISFDGGAAAGIGLDFALFENPDQRVGLWASTHTGSFDASAGLTGPDMDITHIHFTGTSYYPQGNWEHFVLAGIGATQFSPDDPTLEDDTRFSFQVGGGTQLRLGEQFLFRLEARWVPTLFNGSAAGICSGGCVIAVKSDTYSQVQVNAGFVLRF